MSLNFLLLATGLAVLAIAAYELVGLVRRRAARRKADAAVAELKRAAE